jgi:hypothetical protein
VKSHSTSQKNHESSRPARFVELESRQGIENDVEGDADAESDHGCKHLGMQLDDSMMITLGAELAQVSNRRSLEQLYFCEFHPHWPILHQDTFQRKTQPEELVQAVLIAGLWMIDTAKTRLLAESYHDKLVKRQCKYIVKQCPIIFSGNHGPSD